MNIIAELSRKLPPMTAMPMTAEWCPNALVIVSFSKMAPVAPIPSTAKSRAVSKAISHVGACTLDAVAKMTNAIPNANGIPM
jgi:hypothetical protein